MTVVDTVKANVSRKERRLDDSEMTQDLVLSLFPNENAMDFAVKNTRIMLKTHFMLTAFGLSPYFDNLLVID